MSGPRVTERPANLDGAIRARSSAGPGDYREIFTTVHRTHAWRLCVGCVLPFNAVATTRSHQVQPMWNRPRFDLKVRLTLRVAAISAACFTAISAYFLITSDREAHARLDDIAAIVAKTLELQQGKIQWVASPRSDFPNLDP